MYEYQNGSKRIIFALDSIKEDKNKIQRLADILNYQPEQLKQDIEAVCDVVIDHFNEEN